MYILFSLGEIMSRDRVEIELEPEKLEPMIPVTVKMKVSFIKKIDHLTRQLGFKHRSDFIRKALEFTINNLDDFKRFIRGD